MIFWNSTLGIQNGLKIPGQDVWYKRCKYEQNFNLCNIILLTVDIVSIWFFQDKIWMHGFAVADVKLDGKLSLEQFKVAVQAAQKCAKAKETKLLNDTSNKNPENPEAQSTKTE